MSLDPGTGGGSRASRARRVLVVDDDLDTAEVLSMILADEGYEVRFALGPHDALAIVREFPADIAILDIGLPMITGDELAELLQAQLAAYRCRFIAMTGLSPAELAERNAKARFEAHLVKPVAVDALLAVLAEA